jgi:hypothetical protein
MGKGTAFDWERYAGDRWSAEEVGNEIAGKLLGLREEDGRSGVLPVLTLETTDGEREVWAGQVHLQQQLAKLKPKIGDYLTITLTELRNTGQPSPMKIFAVKLEPAGSNDFSEEAF